MPEALMEVHFSQGVFTRLRKKLLGSLGFMASEITSKQTR